MRNFALHAEFVKAARPKPRTPFDTIFAGTILGRLFPPRETIYLRVSICSIYDYGTGQDRLNALLPLPEGIDPGQVSLRLEEGEDYFVSYELDFAMRSLHTILGLDKAEDTILWVDGRVCDRRALDLGVLDLLAFYHPQAFRRITVADVAGARAFFQMNGLALPDMTPAEVLGSPVSVTESLRAELIALDFFTKEQVIWTRDFTPEHQKLMIEEHQRLLDVAARSAQGEFDDVPAFEGSDIAKAAGPNVNDPVELERLLTERRREKERMIRELQQGVYGNAHNYNLLLDHPEGRGL